MTRRRGHLLDSLREAGAQEQAAALLARDPAAHVSLDDPRAVAGCWTACGGRARRSRSPRCWPRPAAHVPLDDPFGVAVLLDSLREAGAHEQVAALADRAAAHVPLDDPDAVAACWTACGRRARTSRSPRCGP